jgi:hypothetical protein
MDSYNGFEPQVGEINALRTFRIGPDGRLYPLFSDLAWAHAANTARCNVPRAAVDQFGEQPHVAPEPDCTCGYYAYASESGAAEHAHARYVLAVISCWGRVIAGTRGIRAEHARVDALWMSEIVPRELAASVAARYPSTSIYADKSTMLTEHPPTQLDCYEKAADPAQNRQRLGLRIMIIAALVIGSLPASWIWHNHDARLIWAGELAFFSIAAVILRVTRRDVRARGATLFYAAIAMWLLAPFAGAAGIFLLRLPILQIATLGLIQRAHVDREARRFPARIGRPER